VHGCLKNERSGPDSFEAVRSTDFSKEEVEEVSFKIYMHNHNFSSCERKITRVQLSKEFATGGVLNGWRNVIVDQ
jgi:hypothetical protein